MKLNFKVNFEFKFYLFKIMSININPHVLSELAKLRKEVKNNFLVEKIQNQGLSQSLDKLYKPLLKSNDATKEALIKHITDISNKYNTNLLEFKNTFSNFPNLIAGIDSIKETLNKNADGIITEITTTNQINDAILTRVANLDEQFQELNRLLTKPESYPKLFDTPQSYKHPTASEETEDDISVSEDVQKILDKYSPKTIITPSTSGIESTAATIPKAEYIDKYHETLKDTNPTTLINHLVGISDQNSYENSKLQYSQILQKHHNQNLIKDYVEHSDKLDFRVNPWKTIHDVDKPFYDELVEKRSKHKHKKGTGITTLASDADAIQELQRLMGSYKSGNTAVFNELESVVDYLRRRGLITLKQSKKLYKEII